MPNLLIFEKQTKKCHFLLLNSKKHDNPKVEVGVENKHLECVENVD